MPRRPFGRTRSQRPTGVKTVIVCEGESEFGYFDAIRQEKRLSKYLLNVENPGASDPKSLVELAVQTRTGLIEEAAWSADDTVWCVFDGDEHIENDPDNW